MNKNENDTIKWGVVNPLSEINVTFIDLALGQPAFPKFNENRNWTIGEVLEKNV